MKKQDLNENEKKETYLLRLDNYSFNKFVLEAIEEKIMKENMYYGKKRS